MAHSILMPKAGQSMTEGTIVSWFKQEGETVQAGDALLEIVTDKANLEVEALESGTLRKIFRGEGDVCPVLSVIGIIGGADEAIDFDALRAEGDRAASQAAESEASPKPARGATSSQTSSKPRAEKNGRTGVAAPRASVTSRAAAPLGARTGDSSSSSATRRAPRARTRSAPTTSERVAVSPLARRLAEELGVELDGLTGSGPGGRIVRDDVERAPRRRQAAANGMTPISSLDDYPPPSPRPDARVELQGMRGAIASALQQSKSSIPHFYTTMAIDMTAALELKDELARSGHRVTVNDLVLRATTLALLDEPGVNCRVHDDSIEYPESVHLGVAVGNDDGLVVPVLLDAQSYDLASLAAESREVIQNALSGRLTGTGRGTFTISNLGMFGVESFTAIINPPEGAILAVGGIHSELVPYAGGLLPRSKMRVTLSADHRAIDGVLAARFLKRLKVLLETAQIG